MIPSYDLADWHWHVAEVDRYWSSAARAYSDQAPELFTRISTEADLRDAMSAAGLADRAPGYVPASIAMWQARAVLTAQGHFSAVDSALQSAGGAALAAWEYAPTISRDSPLVTQMAGLLGLTADNVDEMFRAAANLRV